MQIDPINSNPYNSFSSGSISSRDLDPLVKLISTRLGVSEFTAFTVLRKFMGTANANTFADISNFVTEFLNEGNPRQVAELAGDLQNIQSDPKAQESSYKSVLARLNYGLQEAKANIIQQRQSPTEAMAYDRFLGASQLRANNPATQLVQSPKLFASWLVNNKAAFVNLKAYPQVTNLLLALQNPELSKSPILLSQISVLITQLLKLKAGKSLTEDADEVRKDITDKDNLVEALDHEHNIVNTVKNTSHATTVDTVKDFLLEAERFAEEEIANLWSLTLKKEKELENKLKSGFEKFKKKK